MDWNNIEQQARTLVPPQALKSNRCWIGVLNHNKSIQDELKESDITWFIGHGKTTAQKVQGQYQAYKNLQGIQLYFQDLLVCDSDFIGRFLKPNDDLVLFMAVRHVQVSAPSHTQGSDMSGPNDKVTSATQSHGNIETRPAVPDASTDILATDTLQVRIKEEEPSLPLPNSSMLNDDAINMPVTLNPNAASNSLPEENNKEYYSSLDRYIRHIIKLQDPDILDAGLDRAMQILDSLKRSLSSQPGINMDAASWMQAIEKLIPQAERKRTVIGVVGNTGAGKSSVINALLEEERLVPTNCMRACTAVVTEISWNDSTDMSSKYRAEIEFISAVEWEKELKILKQEFLSENGTLSREAQDPNSDAGIAWAKFHAVYPILAKNSLHDSDIPTLMSQDTVTKVLGTTKQICSHRPEDFYAELQEYVDSKEKVSRKGKVKSKNKGKVADKVQKGPQMEFWPLIKVVKIYTKSSALSTGAVIVDLPGVQDSNAARAAVAQRYLKQCTGLWVVAPINRAVDNKSAKTLLGDSFKRQLKFDGGLSSVTFICSKTDHISITEAIDSLDLKEDVARLEERRGNYNQQITEAYSKIASLKESQEVYKLAFMEACDEIETWETLQEQFNEGIEVYAPLPQAKKRKNIGSKRQSRRKRQETEDADDEYIDSQDEEPDSEDELQFVAERLRLSGPDIKLKLNELRETRKNARKEDLTLKNELSALNLHINKLHNEENKIRTTVNRICIAERNLYSKSAIQQHFAAGIKELDQESAAEADEGSFNPDKEMRDYDQVARSLPVFCVSSRAYQKMRGHMQKDDDILGFMNIWDTEIPQLQAHCKKLTTPVRLQTSRAFLTSFCQLLNTFNLLISDDHAALELIDKGKQDELFKHLDKILSEMTAGLENSVRAYIKKMQCELKTQIFNRWPTLIDDATETAIETACEWGNKNQGGLSWASYKAVVRRNGVFRSAAAGERDFNSDLVGPIMKRLARGWERTFQTRLPKVLTNYTDDCGKLLQKFHETIGKHTKDTGVGVVNLSILKTQVLDYKQLFRDLGVSLVAQMNDLQREANRSFTPCIVDAMKTVYDKCSAEYGEGSFKRMKEHMNEHVDQVRHTMFYESTKNVEKLLDTMCEKLEESMEAKSKDIFAKLNDDLMRALGQKIGDQPMHLQSAGDGELRGALRDILDSTDAQFEAIVNEHQCGINNEELNHYEINDLAEDSANEE